MEKVERGGWRGGRTGGKRDTEGKEGQVKGVEETGKVKGERENPKERTRQKEQKRSEQEERGRREVHVKTIFMNIVIKSSNLILI